MGHHRWTDFPRDRTVFQRYPTCSECWAVCISSGECSADQGDEAGCRHFETRTCSVPRGGRFRTVGSDLDAATQQQLLRGATLTELLKQKQFVPMTTPEIIVSIWSATRGYLDKLATKEILRFEDLWLKHVHSSHSHLLTSLQTEKQITPDIENGLKAAVDEFLGMHELEAKAA